MRARSNDVDTYFNEPSIMAAQLPVYMNNQLFGCFDDVGDCLYACCCPSCHLGSIAQRTAVGDCFGTCCMNTIAYGFGFGVCHSKGVLQSALYRVGVSAPIGVFECCCCPVCLQCQVSREVNDRQAAAALAPPMQAQQPQVIVVQAPAVQAMCTS